MRDRYSGRLYVRLISAEALHQYMVFRNETNRSLASKTDDGVGREIIGHLRSGKRKTCSPHTARSIEKALNAPPGSLFVPEVASGQAGSRRAS